MSEVKDDRGKQIKYIAVEMLIRKEIAKGNTELEEKVEYGLLKGIELVLDDKDDVDGVEAKIILYDKPEKVTSYLSTESYTVVSFEIFDGVNRDITFFRNCKQDQDQAFNHLADALSLMQDADRVMPNKDVIDVSTYSDLPEPLTGKETTTTNPVYPYQMGNYTSSYTAGTAKSHIKEKKPSLLKRTSKHPNWELLQKMKEKITQIATGNYEGGSAFPIFEDDDSEDDKEADSAEKTTKTLSMDGVKDADDWKTHDWEYMGSL